MITIDLSDVLLYLIPFIVIWVIMHKIVLKSYENDIRTFFSLVFSILIFELFILLSDLNFKIQL